MNVVLPSGSLVNTATVDPTNAFVEADESAGDNTKSVTATVTNPRNLTILKTKTSPTGTVGQTGTVVWSIVVTSVGTPTATVRVEDNLPANLNFTSVTTSAVQAGSSFQCFNPSGAAPKMVRREGATAGTIFWGVLLGLVFVCIYSAAVAFLQIGFAHFIARVLLRGEGSLFGVAQPALLGWFVNGLTLIPVAGPVLAAIAWAAVLMKILEEVDGTARLPAVTVTEDAWRGRETRSRSARATG